MFFVLGLDITYVMFDEEIARLYEQYLPTATKIAFYRRN